MALREIKPARLNGFGAPAIQFINYANAQTFVRGAVLALSSGTVIEATSAITGATIFGVAMQGVGTNPGYDVANNTQLLQVTGQQQAVSVALADAQSVFSCNLVNNSATVVAPTAADIGVNYGLKPYSGVWVVDKNQTAGNACVSVIDIDTDLNLVFWRFMAARLDITV